MQGGFRSSEQGSDQVVRTQEIHIVSSNSRHQDQKQERHQSQDNSPQFEPMMFSNTPFSVGEDGKRKGRRNQVVPAWRYSFVVCLVMVDLAVMLISLSISLWANDAAYNAINGAMPFWLFLICFSLIWVLSLTFAGTYHRHVMAEGYELYAKIINASLLTIITYCSLAFIFNLSLPRTALIVAPIIAFFLEVIARWQMRQWQHRSRQKGACKYKTVVIGSSDGINCALRTMRDYSNWGYSPIAVCPIEADDNEKDAYVVTSFEPDPSIEGADKLKVIPFNAAFPRTCESLGAQEVYVADVLSRDSEMLHGISLAVESLGMELALAVSLADVSGHRLYLRNTAEQPVLLASLPQYTNTTYVIKRLLDIVGSAFALLISSPLMLGTAIAIKLDDGGPIFFSQQRIGLHGKPFTMYKFRSMVTNAEELKKKLAEENGQTDRFIFKMKDDPRITKVGRFIRKTSLDEFPQFFNVLKGDMSLVGPRPALPEEVARYGSLYSTRLLVKPGITGPWQVSGRSDLSQEQSEYLDVSYIENWSIAGDLAILAKTVLDWMQWQPFQRYGERSLGNVFTTYYAFIFDWGIAGAMLAVVLIAALSQLCYESAVFALQYGKAGIPISMMLYGAIGYCCAFSFFSNRWMSTMFNQIMLRNIIIWVVLIFFVNSVRIRKRAFAKRVVLYA